MTEEEFPEGREMLFKDIGDRKVTKRIKGEPKVEVGLLTFERMLQATVNHKNNTLFDTDDGPSAGDIDDHEWWAGKLEAALDDGKDAMLQGLKDSDMPEQAVERYKDIYNL